MLKTLYVLLAINSTGDAFDIDSGLTASECIGQVAILQTPVIMHLDGFDEEIIAIECEEVKQ